MSVKPALRAFATRAFARTVGRSRRVHALACRVGWLPPEERVRWLGARTVGEASRALTARAGREMTRPGAWVLLVGADGPLRRSLTRKFTRLGWNHRWASEPREFGLAWLDGGEPPACVVATDVKAAATTDAVRHALDDPRLTTVPFEYATGLEPEHMQFRAQDEYADTWFSSPALLADPSPYEIYDASLERFEQKCGLRDYLDLYQLLVSVVERGVAGDVAEFGSYRGHSGWLIAKTLEGLGSDRRVHLFDTFESFPQEEAGVDYFWSGTHEVRLDEVRDKLSEFGAVRMVPGEFEQTVASSGVEQLSLAYVDCDSYRAVRYLSRALFEDRLAPGGVMVFEDYGHPALLGCRVAVHEYFDGRTDCLRFFSQFSGSFVVVKLGQEMARS